MILEVIIENILSFKNKTSFYFDSVTTITGDNNSGKTNLFKILNLVRKMLRTSNNLLSSYLFNDDNSSFEITFIINDTKYTYGFVFNRKVIFKEYLYCQDTIIYEETNISKLSIKSNEKLNDIYKFLTYDIAIFFSIRDLIEPSFTLYSKDTNNKLKPYILNFFKKVNINIIDYKVTPLKIGNNTGYNTKFKYKIDDKNYIIDYGDESLSNRLVFALIPFVLKAREDNKILIIDDLDSFLDNKIIIEIINMFNNGQLIFSSHNKYRFNCKRIEL